MNEEYDVIVLGTGLTVRRGGGPGPGGGRPHALLSLVFPAPRAARPGVSSRGGPSGRAVSAAGPAGKGPRGVQKPGPDRCLDGLGRPSKGLRNARPRKPGLRRRCASLAGRGPLAPGDRKEWGRVKPSPVAFPPQLPGPAASQFR